jgi:hypothetical protein
MEKSIFLSQIATIEAYYSRKYPDIAVMILWNRLKTIDHDNFVSMCASVVESFRGTSTTPLPLLPDFLDATGSSIEDTGRLLIAATKTAVRTIGPYESIDFSDTAYMAALSSFGTWPAICSMTDREWDVNEGRLLQLYASMSKSGIRHDGYMVGITEQNSSVGYKIHKLDTKTKSMPFIKCKPAEYHQLNNTTHNQKQISESKIIDDVATKLSIERDFL